MSDHDSPISIHGGGTLAKAIVSQEQDHWSVPDGAILSSWAKRLVAFVIDVIIVFSILNLATKGMIRNALNITLWASSDFHYAVAFAAILLTSHWLYWRLTGLAFSRSLGQKVLGIAVVMDDGGGVASKVWDRRAFGKLLFLLPIVNLYFGVYELARISQRHTHQSNLDLKVGTIVAHSESLPPASRKNIR
tara:strand:+ start:2029 stop:2601 length:573 start_codon:yes stop_codon:yes gene_type:complete